MIGLHANQKKTLEYLLEQQEGATLDAIAEHLQLTKTAAREHVMKIQAMGMITNEDDKGSIGRPRRRYLLTPEGHEAFPRQYSWLSTVLLEFLTEDLGGQKMTETMEGLALRIVKSLEKRFSDKSSVPERLTEVTKVMNELGYRASLKQSDLRKGAIIEATNCVYHSVAKAHPELCAFDIKFIQAASGGKTVKLESCIARGGSVCRFCIRNA